MSKREENRARKVASLKNREGFLEEEGFRKNLDSYSKDKELVKALSSQGSWSKYSRSGFIPMTLNTYKKLAEEHLYNGFKGIDSKREKALLLITTYLAEGKNYKREIRSDTKSGLKAKNKNKDRQLSLLREANLILSKGIEVTIVSLEKLKKESNDSKTTDIIQSDLVKIKALMRRYESIDKEDKKLENE